MNSWLMPELGFSWLGLLFLICLFVPNILFGQNMPQDYKELSAEEPAGLLMLERTGQATVSFLILFARDFAWTTWTSWSGWLLLGWVAVALYLACWTRYFVGPHSAARLHRPLLGIPVPLAVLPVAAALLFGIYARSFWLILASIVLGIGHIGIHVQHLRSARRFD